MKEEKGGWAGGMGGFICIYDPITFDAASPLPWGVGR
jgi:hypothetical protein